MGSLAIPVDATAATAGGGCSAEKREERVAVVRGNAILRGAAGGIGRKRKTSGEGGASRGIRIGSRAFRLHVGRPGGSRPAAGFDARQSSSGNRNRSCRRRSGGST